MKNTQKGFISIAVIIWVIVGALIVGGTTYVVVNQMSDNEGNAPKDVKSGQSAGIKTDDDNDGQPAEVNFDTSSTVQTETSISTGTGVATGAGVAAGGISTNTGTANSNEWFYVPELRVRFKNVTGFTPRYTVKSNNSTFAPEIYFFSKEIDTKAMSDKNYAGCTTFEPFGVIISNNIPKSQLEYPITAETTLGKWRYLQFTHSQAGCTDFSNPTELAEQNKFISAQYSLFLKFFASAEAY